LFISTAPEPVIVSSVAPADVIAPVVNLVVASIVNDVAEAAKARAPIVFAAPVELIL